MSSIAPEPGDARFDRLRALPVRYYTDPEILEREKERLFFKSLLYACHISELDAPGAFVATDILGQNVFVVRDKEGEIRTFCNVCPHRGHKLLDFTKRRIEHKVVGDIRSLLGDSSPICR